MQERYIENAVYQEAIYKIFHGIQCHPDGFVNAKPWHYYAEEFAPDATPDEIEAFTSEIPHYHDDRGDIVNLPPGHAIQFYGALALHSVVENPELHTYSIRQANQVTATLRRREKLHEVNPSAVGQFIDILCRTNHLDMAVETAQQYGRNQIKPYMSKRINYLYSVTTTLEDHGISTENNVKELWTVANHALEEFNTNKSPRSSEQDVLRFCVSRLYAQEPDATTTFCMDNNLPWELALAVSANGETVDDALLAQALKTTVLRRNMKRLADLAIAAGPEREPQVHKRIGLFDRANRRLYTQYLLSAKSQLAVKDGDFPRAFRLARKSGSTRHLADTRDALKATGDPELYCEIRHKYDPTAYGSPNFVGTTIPMLIKKDDIAGAIELIRGEPEESRSAYWCEFTKAYIAYEIDRNDGAELTAETIINFANQDYNLEADMSSAYAGYHAQLYNAGLLETAKDLSTEVRSMGPTQAKSFNYYALPEITREAIRSGNWIEAMHGDHLPNPGEGIEQAIYLLLIAGSIHRARTQRKQEADQKTKELPKQPVVRYNTT